jgi:hypothetical protein
MFSFCPSRGAGDGGPSFGRALLGEYLVEAALMRDVDEIFALLLFLGERVLASKPERSGRLSMLASEPSLDSLLLS